MPPPYFKLSTNPHDFLMSFVVIVLGIVIGLLFGLRSVLISQPNQTSDTSQNITATFVLLAVCILLLIFSVSRTLHGEYAKGTIYIFGLLLLPVIASMVLGVAWGYNPYINDSDKQKTFYAALGLLGFILLLTIYCVWLVGHGKDVSPFIILLIGVVFFIVGWLFFSIRDTIQNNNNVPTESKNGYIALLSLSIVAGAVGMGIGVYRLYQAHKGNNTPSNQEVEMNELPSSKSE